MDLPHSTAKFPERGVASGRFSVFDSCFKAFDNREVKVVQIGYGFSFDFLTLSRLYG
ncbi:MAG: hypothetical protein OXC03_01760 [Flavobacteriaceae bacterium]|nr:hypothetical protein [Flavobacteriaceae bacterium]